MIGYGNSMFLATHGILARAASGAAVDPDAQAFITAAAITDPTQQAAINQLVVNLKGYGVWTKMKAIYPFVGGTASTMKWNLKDPRDLDAAFRLLFIGGGTWNNNGYTPNGFNGYADTKFIPSSHFVGASNAGWTQYQNSAGDLSGYSGCFDNTARFLTQLTTSVFDARLNSDTLIYQVAYVSNGKGTVTISKNANTTARCFHLGVYRGEIAEYTYAPTVSAYIGARNGNGTASAFDVKTEKFHAFHNGLSDTEAANLNTAVQAFQTTLGRQV